MGKVTDKILNFMKFSEEDEYEQNEDGFFDDEDEDEAEADDVQSDDAQSDDAPEETSRVRSFFSRREEEKQEEEEKEEEDTAPIRETVKRVDFTSRRAGRVVSSVDRGGEMVKVVRAQEFEEVKAMMDLLKDDKIVVINLEEVKNDVAQRIIDCTSGASYALDGKLESVNDNIFILAPKGVEITGDLKNKLKNGSISPELSVH